MDIVSSIIIDRIACIVQEYGQFVQVAVTQAVRTGHGALCAREALVQSSPCVAPLLIAQPFPSLSTSCASQSHATAACPAPSHEQRRSPLVLTAQHHSVAVSEC